MTEMQPTEIELTAKKKRPESVSKRKIAAIIAIIIVIAAIAAFTAILANQASSDPESVQGQVAPIPTDAVTTAPEDSANAK
jgi:flagellar basal body-associated protein FliL